MIKETYSIGEAAKMFDLSVATIRYYDQEGLIPNLHKKSGFRRFNKDNLDALQMIECLKNAGMSIKDIRQFMEWNVEGDQTLPLRLKMFQQLRDKIQQQMDELQKTLNVANYKCHYYQQAIDDGTEKYVAQKKEYVMDLVKK